MLLYFYGAFSYFLICSGCNKTKYVLDVDYSFMLILFFLLADHKWDGTDEKTKIWQCWYGFCTRNWRLWPWQGNSIYFLWYWRVLGFDPHTVSFLASLIGIIEYSVGTPSHTQHPLACRWRKKMRGRTQEEHTKWSCLKLWAAAALLFIDTLGQGENLQGMAL